jgi:hypothetical protein
MDLRTRCIKCESYRYFDVNNLGVFDPEWICATCLPGEYERLKSAYTDLVHRLAAIIEHDAQCAAPT